MMGDRDYRQLIHSAIESIGKELDISIDVKDTKIIHLHEIVKCLRRSYYDRTDSKPQDRSGFNDLTSGLLRKLHYGVEVKDYDLNGLTLRGQADMIVDDSVMIFRSSDDILQNPLGEDILYLNALLWIYNKHDGIIIYITGDRKEVSFSLTKDKKMFEEVARRVRVFNNLLEEKKIPILEPSISCSRCQYYERCFIKQKLSKQISISQLVGLDRD